MRALALEDAHRRIAELEAELRRLRNDAPMPFWTRSQGSFRRVAVDALDWIEAERDYVRLHTADGVFFHAESLGSLESRLESAQFRRVHRSAIVRWDRVREVRRLSGGALAVITALGTQVRIGRSFAADILAALEPR